MFVDHVRLEPGSSGDRFGTQMTHPISFIAVGLPTSSPRPPLAGRVRVDGRFWINDAGTYRPCFLSGFKLPALAVQDHGRMCAYLDLACALGFNGVRILAGALSWGPQTAAEAVVGLPLVLEEAVKRSLTIEVTGFSDSGVEGWEYDLDAHLEAIGSCCADYANTLGEVANEPYHETQADEVHEWPNLATWGTEFGERGVCWASGAPETDEPHPDEYPIAGDYLTIHLSRGGGEGDDPVRDEWNMVRRVRELEAVSSQYETPVMNNEPIGWAEVDEPGRRCANPAIAFTMGALSRGFEVGLVSHADHGLECDDPGPVQRQCHEAAVAGFHVFGVETRLVYQNTGWPTSPIASANLDVTIVRAYSFMDSGSHGWTVMLGLTGDPGIVWQNGFGPVRCVAQMEGVEVWEIAC
jgi:hypothetical protein